MDIKILDSWLREHLDTKAKPAEIAKCLSLCGPSVEKTEKVIVNGKQDYIYSIEVTTNRVDMMSVRGIAREASVILPEFGIPAELKKLELDEGKFKGKSDYEMQFKTDPKLVYRIMGVILEIDRLGETPDYIKARLEASGIRSLNAVVDITNYVMTEVGHPTHVFDYDLIKPVILIRESKKGESVTSFDGHEYSLPGGDIVFENDKAEIIDLPGIIGTENSVVRENTKRILYFIDNNDPVRIRKTSMKLGIRTVAATLNEKGVDPALAEVALKRGLYLYRKLIKAKQVSPVYDHFPNKTFTKRIKYKHEFLENKLGISITFEKVTAILNKLDIKTDFNKKDNSYISEPPSYRTKDIQIPEDIVEEVARIYGYHNFPSELMSGKIPEDGTNKAFEFETKLKQVLKGLGGIEVYTLSLVSKEEVGNNPVKVKNPLGSDTLYLRDNMLSSLLKAAKANSGQKEPFHLFEVSNIYLKRKKGELPNEELHVSGIFSNLNYRKAKGIIEALLSQLNINYKVEITESNTFRTMMGISFKSGKQLLGEFGVLENNDLIYYDFEIEKLREFYKEYSAYNEISKYPPQIEDITLELPEKTKVMEIIRTIENSNKFIKGVELTDIYGNAFTFRVQYQSMEKTLTDKEVESIREEFIKTLERSFAASVK